MAHVIELFVANHCPSCPDARMRVYEFAATREDVLVFEHNVDEHLDAAARYGLFATPAIVIDSDSVLYGVPTFAQLRTKCADVTRGEQPQLLGQRRLQRS
jgi:hypothetical protein